MAVSKAKTVSLFVFVFDEILVVPLILLAGDLRFVRVIEGLLVARPFLWFSRSSRASRRAAACAGTTATPKTMLPQTMSLPCHVTGLTSPNPTVVNVVNPKYRASK